MKDFELLPAKGQFYKANMHCHTVISDGTLTPEEIKIVYQQQGYSIVAYTDHRTYGWHPELNDENFLALAAFEGDLNQPEEREIGWQNTKTYHINFYDTDPQTGQDWKKELGEIPADYHDTKSINAFVAQMKEKGFLACYNHPYWSLQDYDDYKDLKGFWGMEIYNHGCEHDGLYGFHPQAYDEMLRTGQRLFALATDDNHNREPFTSPLCDSFGGFVMIKAEELTYPVVIHALQEGNFYYSMGPEIKEAYVKDGKLVVKTSPVEKIFVIQQGRDCYKKAVHPGETLTEAEFPLTGNEGYIRIQVKDGRGLFAGTNAYWV